MIINEITNAAQKIIKEINSLYITYASSGSPEVEQQLWNLLQHYSNNENLDIKKQCEYYKDKLNDNLVRITTKT
jgi:hypothetical protein